MPLVRSHCRPVPALLKNPAECRAGIAAGEMAHDAKRNLVQLEHPQVGRRIHAGIPWKMSASPCSVSKAAPLLGEDTEAVLTSLLKLSNEQIQELRRREITM